MTFAVAYLVHRSRTNTADTTETRDQRRDSVSVPAISPGVNIVILNDNHGEITPQHNISCVVKKYKLGCLSVGESLKLWESFQRDQQDPSSKKKHSGENIHQYSYSPV